MELVKEAIDKAGYTEKIVIGMDVAASEFHRDGKYDLDFKSPADPSRYITGDQLGTLYQDFVRDYPGERKQCEGEVWGQAVSQQLWTLWGADSGTRWRCPKKNLRTRERVQEPPAKTGLCM